MPINPSIPLGVNPLQLQMPDPNQGMNALARVMQIQGAQSQNELARYSLEKAKREDEDQVYLRNELAKPDADPYKVLLGRGRLKEAGDFLKSQNEAKSADATRVKTELETALKKTEHVSSVLSLARDPQSYATVRAVIKQQFGQDLPEQFDPNMVAALTAQGQTLTQRLQAEHQRLTLAETTRHNTTTETETGRHNVRTEGIQGGQLAETRRHNTQMEGFRSNEIGQGKTQIVETPQGFVLVDKNTGQSRPAVGADGQPLKGKANDRVLTDAQAKANLFGTRMKEADRILGTLDGKYSPAAVNARTTAADIPVIGGITGYAANAAASAQTQQAEQAQRDFINAVLRRESGAAIASSEFENAKQQYFPQPGDLPAVKAQKARNRQLAIAGLEAEVPGGFRGAPSLTSTGQSGGATGGWDGGPGRVVDFGSLR